MYLSFLGRCFHIGRCSWKVWSPSALGSMAAHTPVGLTQLPVLHWVRPSTHVIKKSLNLHEIFRYSWVRPGSLISAAILPL